MESSAVVNHKQLAPTNPAVLDCRIGRAVEETDDQTRTLITRCHAPRVKPDPIVEGGSR
jgi:hypothetical protein